MNRRLGADSTWDAHRPPVGVYHDEYPTERVVVGGRAWYVIR